jgi:hypothetical protein
LKRCIKEGKKFIENEFNNLNKWTKIEYDKNLINLCKIEFIDEVIKWEKMKENICEKIIINIKSCNLRNEMNDVMKKIGEEIRKIFLKKKNSEKDLEKKKDKCGEVGKIWDRCYEHLIRSSKLYGKKRKSKNENI